MLYIVAEEKVFIENDKIVYNLRVSNYNKLVDARKRRKFIPYILILFILPKNRNKWVNLKEDQINLKKHCYWYIPTPDIEREIVKDKNSYTKIRIPIENKLRINSFEYFFENLIPG